MEKIKEIHYLGLKLFTTNLGWMCLSGALLFLFAYLKYRILTFIMFGVFIIIIISNVWHFVEDCKKVIK